MNTWTKEIPKKSGKYWVKSKSGLFDPCVMELDTDKDSLSFGSMKISGLKGLNLLYRKFVMKKKR